jgi:hypothetical protein
VSVYMPISLDTPMWTHLRRHMNGTFPRDFLRR